MSAETLSLLNPEQAAWMGGQVSVIVGSRDDRHQPHVMRAVGARVSADRCRITVLLPEDESPQLLDDLRSNGQIAVVFSQPSNNRTLQVKGHDAQVAAADAEDLALSGRYLVGFMDEIGKLGFGAEVAHTMLGHEGGLAAVHFSVAAAFEQTPGQGAGRPLEKPVD